MAIYRGTGGSVEGITEADILSIAISQGGTGAQTAAGARTNLGLGTAATTASSDYATAAQGTLADSAVQPADIGDVATSNSYNDLDNLPTLGTAAATDADEYATAAQGSLADSAVQPADLATVATTGAYSDLTGKPTVPTTLDSLTDVVITSASTNQLLKFDGSNWVNATVGGSGTVTSVAMSVPTGLSVSGSPVTTTGTLAVSLTSGYAIPTTAKQTEWDTAYTDRNKWDGGATGLTAATGRTSLGATTVGGNLFTLTNPSAVTFVRLNADNTASALSASAFRTAIGAGTSSTTGTVTSVAMTVPTGLSISGSPVTSTGTLAVTLTAGYSIPTTANQTNWTTAYGWGNHASAGYLTSSSTLDASKLSGTIDGGTY